VAEITQKRRACFAATNESCTFYGGSTVIIDPDGYIRYVIKKDVTNAARLLQQKQFLDSALGMRHKPSLCGTETPNLFMMLHESSSDGKDEPINA
jgi:hypothetical protein